MRKTAKKGPYKWVLNESSKSPFNAKHVDLVKKHVGQGTPVIALIGHVIPGRE